MHIIHQLITFSECLAHKNHPNFIKSLGHQPQPRVILILSNGLESNWHITPKTIRQKGTTDRVAVVTSFQMFLNPFRVGSSCIASFFRS